MKLFDATYDALASSARTADPGAPGADPVDERLKAEERAAARAKVKKVREAAYAAFETDDLGEALDGWVEVFGPSFPAPSTAPEQIAAALVSGSAGAEGTGIRPKRGRQIIQPRSWRRR